MTEKFLQQKIWYGVFCKFCQKSVSVELFVDVDHTGQIYSPRELVYMVAENLPDDWHYKAYTLYPSGMVMDCREFSCITCFRHSPVKRYGY